MSPDFKEVEELLELLFIEEDTYSEEQKTKLHYFLEKQFDDCRSQKAKDKHFDVLLLKHYINDRINQMLIRKAKESVYFLLPFVDDFSNCVDDLKGYWKGLSQAKQCKKEICFPRKFDIAIDCIYDVINFYNMYNIYSQTDQYKIVTSLINTMKDEKETQEKNFRRIVTDKLDEAIVTAKESFTGIAKTVGMQIAAESVKEELTSEVESKAQKIVKNEIINTLGIFAGIIIAVVAAFIYSSSVLNNILTVDTYKLLFVCLTVGMVFINIIFSMFYYVERIKTPKEGEETPKGDRKKTEKTTADSKIPSKGFWLELRDSISNFIKNHTYIFLLNVIFAIILVFFAIFYEPVEINDPNNDLSNGIYCCTCANVKENNAIDSMQAKCSCECHYTRTENPNEGTVTEEIAEDMTEYVTEDIAEDMTEYAAEDVTDSHNTVT